MNKKISLLIGVVLVLVVLGYLFYSSKQKNFLSNPTSNLHKDIKPSDTFIDYTDPSGFSFSYPDNLSISNLKTESEEDNNAYADLQLFSKDKNGSLTLRIIDSQYKSLDDWLKANKIASSSASVEKKLGNLKALEVKTSDRLMLAALDQGVLFTVEMPLIEQNFWGQVYDKILSNFTFSSPPAADSSSSDSSDDVAFEGEEVIE